jgi:hypothetical protein
MGREEYWSNYNMPIHKILFSLGLIATITATSLAKPKAFDEVNDGYTKVVSTIDGTTPLFGLWKNAKEQQLLVVGNAKISSLP